MAKRKLFLGMAVALLTFTAASVFAKGESKKWYNSYARAWKGQNSL